MKNDTKTKLEEALFKTLQSAVGEKYGNDIAAPENELLNIPELQSNPTLEKALETTLRRLDEKVGNVADKKLRIDR